MFRSKKGFTLVELLAVIVILAIILAIAVPGISGIINSAKKGAFESDAKMIVAGIEYKVLEASIDSSKATDVPAEAADISANVDKYGANPANYTSVVVDSLSPVTITLTTKTTSEFGEFTATATRTTVTYPAQP
jgi:type IV pilus assembly protein PilA